MRNPNGKGAAAAPPLAPTEAADLAEGRRLVAEFHAGSAQWDAVEKQNNADYEEYERLKADRGHEVAGAYWQPREDALNAAVGRVSVVREQMEAYVQRLHGVALEPNVDSNPTGFAVSIGENLLVVSVSYATDQVELFIVPATAVRHLGKKGGRR